VTLADCRLGAEEGRPTLVATVVAGAGVPLLPVWAYRRDGDPEYAPEPEEPCDICDWDA
jgi:hypothetical protein